jgi:hypothetical protein
LGSDEPLLRVCRRHSDVDDRHVRPVEANTVVERVGIGDRRADLDAGIAKQTRKPFAH